MSRVSRWQVAAALMLSGAWSCMNATDVELLEISGTGVVFGQAFLDQNGTGVADAGDAPLRGAAVQLVAQGTQTVIDSETTDTLGIFVMTDVPVGAYEVRLDTTVLGDSLTALGPGGAVTVELGDTTPFSLGASYPSMTLAEALLAAPGRRIFTSGIVLNPRQPNGDGLVFFKGPAGYLRGTNVERANLTAGDSVRMIGRTGLDQGRPVLDAVTTFLLVSQAQFPIPVEVTSAVARTASGGTLDGALVRIRDAEIRDTSTVANDFRFWAHSGGDSVEVVLRSFLGIFPNPPIRPDTVVAVNQAIGLLAPVADGLGNVRWRLLVRSAGEIVTFTKQVDLALTTGFDTLQASAGDTVEIRVTVSNASGGRTATGVTVVDTLAAPLTFLSASATRGSYDQATRIWSVGDLAPGAPADTLRIQVQVTGGPGVVANIARLGALLREVDVNAANNAVITTPNNLTIS